MGTKKILFLLCGLAVLNWYHSESKKAVKGHCGSKGRKDRWRGCKKRDGSKEPTTNPTNTPTVEPTNTPTTAPSQSPTVSPTKALLSPPTNSPTNRTFNINGKWCSSYVYETSCQPTEVGDVCANWDEVNKGYCVKTGGGSFWCLTCTG